MWPVRAERKEEQEKGGEEGRVVNNTERGRSTCIVHVKEAREGGGKEESVYTVGKTI